MKDQSIKPLWIGLLGALLMGLATSAQANLITIDSESEKATVDCTAGAIDPACEGVIGAVGLASLSELYADIYDVSPSNETAETDFLNSLMGAGTVNVSDTTKIDLRGADSADFATSALWFTIKTGKGNSFFRNNGGPVDLSVVYQKADGKDGAGMGISHVTFWGGETTKIPAPGTLALLGFGLLGLALIRRSRVG